MDADELRKHAMIYESLIRAALTPDDLEVAKARVQTRVVGKILRERKALVHAALKCGVPTAHVGPGCSGSDV